jgi:hypothetical protein
LGRAVFVVGHGAKKVLFGSKIIARILHRYSHAYLQASIEGSARLGLGKPASIFELLKLEKKGD